MSSRALPSWIRQLLAAVVTSSLPAGVGAQPSYVEAADALVTGGDSTKALEVLHEGLRRDGRNAVAWYRAGMLQWEMARAKRSATYMKDQKAIRLLMGADSSLRLATQYAPDSAAYWMALSRFSMQSGYATTRFAGSRQFVDAFGAAQRSGNRKLLAEAADAIGMTSWRRFEVSANRALATDNRRLSLTNVNLVQRERLLDFVESFARKIEPPTGLADYSDALRRFQEALAADSTNARVSRHLYMALATRGQWQELLSIASLRSAQYPLDAQSRLARGLALHRLDRPRESQVAFDSALALLDDPERDRLTRFSRILRPRATNDQARAAGGDSIAYSTLPEANRRGLEQMYWYLNDPLVLTGENEIRLEFLSRVVYADFRWTDEDLELLGADTDRGDVYVRYGPPDREFTIAGGSTFQLAMDANATLFWYYTKANLLFVFDLTPGFGTGRFAQNDRDFVERVKNAVPVRWDNVESARLLDTIPVRVARFRAGRDSVDAVVAARLPLDTLLRGVPLDRAAIDIDFRVFDEFVRVRGVESSQITVSADSIAAGATRVWTRRLGAGLNVVKVEALQADSRRAATAARRLPVMPTTGFAMSDVLLGSKPVAPASGTPKRWRDVTMTPNEGDFISGAPIGLMWELYETPDRAGQAKYKVAITVERVEKGGAIGAGIRLLDAFGRAVGRGSEGRRKFTITFDRTAPPSPTLVEYLSLDLASAATGSYRLRVEVTEQNSGKRVSRDTEFRIR